MKDKEAMQILIRLVKKPSLNKEEKEAIMAAIGVLGMAALGQSRMKSIIKAKKAKRAKWLEPR